MSAVAFVAREKTVGHDDENAYWPTAFLQLPAYSFLLLKSMVSTQQKANM
jgi:hypothetical protein